MANDGLIFTTLGTFAVDNDALSEFADIASGAFSDQLAGSFTITRNGATITVAGTALTYAGGVPDGGSISGMTVEVGGQAIYRFVTMTTELAVSDFSALFATSDLHAVAKGLFSRSDSVGGSNQADHLWGFAGDDLLAGGLGDDYLYGGAGKDSLSGGADVDHLYGGSGNDTLSGDTGDDWLNGGSGSDTASYFRRLASVTATLDDDRAGVARVGAFDRDTLFNIENLWGGLNADRLTGDSGNNTLIGDAGADQLSGRAGRDVLAGGYDNDILTGGGGRDTFLFDKLLAGHNFINIDRITDFAHGVDSIHLVKPIFGALTEGDLSPANFRAAPHAISGTGDQFIVYDTASGNLYYDASGDGSGLVFQFAHLKGAPDLQASDFFVV